MSSGTYKGVMRGVIRRALIDLVQGDIVVSEDAKGYLRSQAFLDHIAVAEYPDGLADAVDEILQMTPTQQAHLMPKLLAAVDRA